MSADNLRVLLAGPDTSVRQHLHALLDEDSLQTTQYDLDANAQSLAAFDALPQFDAVLLGAATAGDAILTSIAAVQTRFGVAAPPIIVVVEEDGDATGATVRAGAHDYLLERSLNPADLDRTLRLAVARTSHVRRLYAQEARFQSAMESLPVMVWSADVEMSCDYVNRAWLAFTGSTLEQELGEGWLRGMHPDDREPVFKIWQAAFERRAPYALRYRLRRHDGVYRWISDLAAPHFSADGTFLGYIGNALDVTDELNTETALRKSQERLALAAEVSGAGIFEHDLVARRAIYHSPAWARILGYRPDELPAPDALLSWLLDQLHPADRAAVTTLHERVTAGELDVFVSEHRLRRQDGSYCWVRAIAKPFNPAPDGQPTRMVGVMQDIDEQKRHEFDLELLADASAVFPAQKEAEGVLRTLLQLLIEQMADFAVVYTTGANGHAERKAVQVANPKHVDALAVILRHELTPDNPVVQAIVAGDPLVISELSETQLERLARSEEEAAQLKQLEIRSLAIIPLVLFDRPVGALGLARRRVHPQGPFTERDLTLLQEVGRRAALAYDNALLLERQAAAREELRRHAALARRHLRELQVIYATAPIGLAFTDREHRYRNVNSQMASFVGIRRDDMIGRHVAEVLPALTAEAGIRERERVIATGEPAIDVEIFGPTRAEPDVPRYWLASYFPVLDSEGMLLGVNTVLRDITERRLARLGLQESETRFRNTFEQAAVGMAHVGLDGRFIRLNRRLTEIVGYSVEELQTLTFQEITHPLDLDADVALMHQLLDGTIGTYSLEKRYLHRDGSVIWVNLTGSLVHHPETGLPDYFIAVIEDISDRKAAEVALRQSEARFRVALANSPMVVYTCDTDLRYTWISNARHGLDPEVDIGQRDEDLFLDGGAEMMAFKRGVLETGEPAHGEVRLRTTEGWRDFDVTAELTYDETGRSAGLTVAALDITERKRTQRELQALNETLELRVHRKTHQVRRLASDLTLAEHRERRRIASVLHDDVQQKLYALQVKLMLLEDALADEPSTTMSASLGELRDLISDVVTQNRSLTVELSPPLLRDEGLLDAFDWLVDHMRSRYGLAVTLNIDQPIPEPADDVRELIFQMVRELLFNVVKHAGVPEAALTLHVEGDWLVIEVEDAGVGFDVAAQLSQGSSSFGLQNIQERLDLFDAVLHLGSVKGQGTRVGISFPVDRLQAVPPAQENGRP